MTLRSFMAALAVFMLVVALAHPAEAKRTIHSRIAAATNAVAIASSVRCDDRYPATCGATQAKRNATAPVGAGVVGSRPSGCPHRFCGCEASLYLFGTIRADLNLASNWARKFPRAAPAPRMAAVRNHHVMILVSHVSGSDWLVHDGNSGGGLTREHVRSIDGYTIVDPSGGRVASQ